ncbi:alpha/beta hydrolase [Georgenia yuyongxinii]|uniref:Alpha/beta hydrolase n=1 Tax=Georgenia yuyongxinii TaxID=2589797 RepID=A0A5B8C9M8_9MICO|nr:alpha/beta hydrolase [Georgenia yuyongxinii]QDC26145.1 alpha/beta hydrolase [Georgenia yuyongxinii]
MSIDSAPRTHTYTELDVAVDGGMLHAGVWEPRGAHDESRAATDGEPGAPSDGVPTVLAIHGITATHRAWDWVAPALAGTRVVAPDLRGRGRSNTLTGPFGMARHADDVAALARDVGARQVVVAGHSMGAFVAVVLAHRHPDLVRSLVLVDGGLPLALPAGLDADAAMTAVLGPAAERLAMSFPDHAAYREFWRSHPAFATCWAEDLGGYFDYDLEPVDGVFRASARLEAMTGDQRELFTGESLLPALSALAVPTTFLRAPFGLMADNPLYQPGTVEEWRGRLPTLRSVEVPDVNHYTIVMTPPGAATVVREITRHLAASTP